MYMTTGKTLALTIWTCVGKVMSLLFNTLSKASQMAQWVMNPTAMQETWVQSLDQQDPLEKEMTNHSSILAWKKSHEQRILVNYSPWVSTRVCHNWASNNSKMVLKGQMSRWISCIHTYIPSFLDFLPIRSPQSTESSSLCYTVGSHFIHSHLFYT